MNQQNITTVLRNLDSCRSIFDVLSHILDNNAGFADLHSLACLAADGKRKCDEMLDAVSE